MVITTWQLILMLNQLKQECGDRSVQLLFDEQKGSATINFTESMEQAFRAKFEAMKLGFWNQRNLEHKE